MTNISTSPTKLVNHLILYILCFIVYTSSVYAKETVVWAVADRPTSYILEGVDKGRGVVDEVYYLLHKNLKEYEHKTNKMNFARVLQQMENGENQCACGFKKPEREKVGYYSVPAVIALPFSVIVKKGKLEKIYGKTESIALKNLLDNEKFKGGVSKKRSYGNITPLIDTYEKKGNLYAHPSTQNLMKMLMADRLDYAIEIHSFANYIAKQLDNEDIFETYAIDENKNKVLIAYIFCTKNEWGRKIIEKVDRILEKERQTPTYVEIMGRWYDDKGRKIIKDYYNNNFLDLK